MNPNHFIHEAKAYYGQYNRAQEKIVRSWLSQKDERLLPLLWSEVLKALSPVYKTPPGIKELEDALREVKGHRMHEVNAGKILLLEDDNGDLEEGKTFLRGLYEKLDRRKSNGK